MFQARAWPYCLVALLRWICLLCGTRAPVTYLNLERGSPLYLDAVHIQDGRPSLFVGQVRALPLPPYRILSGIRALTCRDTESRG